MQDLASRLGVSRSTISRALRDDPQIAALTRQRIQELARELDYRPNAAAQALTSRRSGVVGLLLPRSSSFVFANPYFSELLQGLSDVAEQQGYPLMFSTALKPPYEAWLREGRVDGLITLGSSVSDEDVVLLNQLVNQGYPVVVIHAAPRALKAVTIGSNERAGIWQALSHLAQLGHRRVVFLAGPRHSRYARKREHAYWSGVDTFALEKDERLRVYGDDTQLGAYQQIQRLLDGEARFTAVLADNDLSAIGAMKALQDLGYRVPEDVSVVGFDDIVLASVVQPALTTVQQPVNELGRRAMSAVLELIAGRKLESLRLATRLVVRQSTAIAKESA